MSGESVDGDLPQPGRFLVAILEIAAGDALEQRRGGQRPGVSAFIVMPSAAQRLAASMAFRAAHRSPSYALLARAG